jgi:hypothetical protein
MKQFYLSFSLLTALIISTVSAQITITHADLPTIGLQVIRAVDDITPISPGEPGLNQIWDFTNLIESRFDTILYLPVAGAPNIQNYPGAEVAIKHLQGQSQVDYDYEYARYSDQGMRYVGDEDLVTIFGEFQIAIHISTTPNPLNLKLPFNYGDVNIENMVYDWTIASRNAGVTMDSSRQISHMTVTSTGDASGFMSTPYGSFPVLRVREDIFSQDSLFSWTPGGWAFNQFEESSWSQYRWYANNYFEVGYYKIDDEKGNTMTFFKSETVVGSSSIPLTSCYKVYPNPASDVVFIEGVSTPDVIEVYNSGGILVMAVSETKSLIVSGLPAGFYFLKVYSGKSFTPLKFIKE